MTNAETAYIRHHCAALQLLQDIETKLMDMPAPDDETTINWGHVGSASHYENQLRQILESFGDA